MKLSQDDFVAARGADWRALESLLARGDRGLYRLDPGDITRAAALYRAVCADLMRARAAGCSADLVAHLDALAARGHNALYSARPYRLGAIASLVTTDFPRTLRRHARAFAAAVALFVLPAVIGFTGAVSSRAFALGVLPAASVEQMEEMYAKGFGDGRAESDDAAMAGFYIYNNVGIAFRCFATGVLFGLGSVFFLLYNGLVIGVVAGLVTAAGHGLHLLTFVAGHGAFELTAIVIAGTAGLVMGYALVETKGRTRFASLRGRARDIASLVLGAALMLVAAAFIEAFWSPSALPVAVKLSVAGGLYVAVAAYLAFAGRRAGEEPRA